MSHPAAISEEDKNRLLLNAGFRAPYKRMADMNIEIRAQTKEQGFKNKAMYMRGTEEYKWAHETPAGIVWLWSKQENADTQKQWLEHKIAHWQNFNYSPSPPQSPSPPYGWTPSRNPSPRRNGASAAAAAAAPKEHSISPTKRRGGGSRKRRTAHKKRKAHRKSKRVHHTRRKHTRRHRRRHRR
jgi:hypothetical protein